MKKITITETNGMDHETTASSDADARWYEDLPFTSENVSTVTVTDDDSDR